MGRNILNRNNFYYLSLIAIGIFYSFAFWIGFAAIVKHGMSWHLLIPLFSAFMIWDNRKSLLNVNKKPNAFLGITILSFAGLLAISGFYTTTQVLVELGFIISIYGIILFLWGKKLFWALILPLLYLLFMSSFTEGAFGFLSPFFKHVTAIISTFFSGVFGFIVLRDDTYLRLPFLLLNVADECSGINHLISLLAFSFPMGIIFRLNKKAILLLAFFSVPLALLSNSIRVFIIILYNYHRTEFTHGPGNIFVTGAGFFIGLFLLILVAYIFSLFNRQISSVNSIQTGINKLYPSHLSTILMILILVVIGSILNFRPVRESKSFETISLSNVVDKDHFKNEITLPQVLQEINASKIISRSIFISDSVSINLHVVMFTKQYQNHEIFSHKLKPLLNNSNVYTCNSKTYKGFNVLKSNYDNQNIYFWFWSGNKFTHNRYIASVFTLYDAFVNQKNNGALFFVITPEKIDQGIEVCSFLTRINESFEKELRIDKGQ